jgi:SAM-dependent methyltransferase
VGVFLAQPDAAPSAWVTRFAPLVRSGGTVLDLACGSGRHLRWLAAQGWQVTGVDRDEAALRPLRGLAELMVADVETGPWPLPGRCFDGIVVTNYLWRPLLPQHIGKPSRPDFLLQSGELLRAFSGLRVVAFEDGFETQPTRYVQRLVAVLEGSKAGTEAGTDADTKASVKTAPGAATETATETATQTATQTATKMPTTRPAPGSAPTPYKLSGPAS